VASAIHILNGTNIGADSLNQLAARVGNVFGMKTDVQKASINIDRAFDQSRGQHNSTALIAQILNAVPLNEEKNILVVEVDLYIPVLTFVFGEAQLNGVASIVSTHRLQNQFYGLSHDYPLMLKRLEKEIVHEVGHNFGLYHCRQFECVMRSSTYVGEIDLKQAVPCAACRNLLKPMG
jgi:archaemetzincin